MEKYDITVVGNGTIGTFATIKLHQNSPDMSMTLTTNANPADSASVAAAAMILVYSEIEECSPEQAVTKVTYNLT